MVEGRAQTLTEALRCLLPPSPGPPGDDPAPPRPGIKCPHPSAAGRRQFPVHFHFLPQDVGNRNLRGGREVLCQMVTNSIEKVKMSMFPFLLVELSPFCV